MENEETPEDVFKTKLKDDITWLNLVCPNPPTAENVEPTAQTLGILKSVNPFIKGLTHKDIIKLALVGYIASCARKSDESRFQEISPYAYFHLAQFWADADNEKEYGEFIKRITG